MNDRLQADSFPRLLEPDKANPGARCVACSTAPVRTLASPTSTRAAGASR